MKRCAKHILFQLPNEEKRVKHLFDSIKTNDDELCAAITEVHTDKKAASYLILWDPFKKHWISKGKQQGVHIGQVNAASSSQKKKPNIGKTSVELHYHTWESYSKLTKEQLAELYEYCQSQKQGSRTHGKLSTSNHETMIVAAVSKHAAKTKKAKEEQEQQLNDFKSLVSLIVKETKELKKAVCISAVDWVKAHRIHKSWKAILSPLLAKKASISAIRIDDNKSEEDKKPKTTSLTVKRNNHQFL